MHDCCLVLIDCPLTFEAKLVRLLDTAVGAAHGSQLDSAACHTYRLFGYANLIKSPQIDLKIRLEAPNLVWSHQKRKQNLMHLIIAQGQPNHERPAQRLSFQFQ
jgi:hypothetical protein